MNPPELPYHPISNLYPLLPDEELKNISEDIKAHGLIDDIVLYEGAILDGRNRYRACRESGVTPRYRQFGSRECDGASPTAFVTSKNLLRRHLTTKERIAIAGKMAIFIQAEDRAKAQNAPVEWPGETSQAKPAGRAVEQAAEALNVSPASVQKAVTVAKVTPEALDEVAAGMKSLDTAYVEAKQEKKARQPAGAKDDAEAASAEALSKLVNDHEPTIHMHLGREFADAFRKGTVLKTAPEIKAFMKLEPAEMRKIHGLIIQGWKVRGAVEFMAAGPQPSTDLTSLALMCASKGEPIKTEVNGYIITCRKKEAGE